MGSVRLAKAALGVALLATVWTSGCSSPTPAPAPAPKATELWGDMKPVVSVKELMEDMLDPIADNIFNSVSIITNKNGTVETSPKTDEDWAKIRIGAVTLAEGVYLLKVPRPFAPPGDVNNSTGPDAVELSPDAIAAKVKADPVEWNARIEALRNVGLEVMEIVEKKDANALWQAAEDLDIACEACHRSYWYPGETLRFYEKLDRRLKDLQERSAQEKSSSAATPRKR